MRSLIAALVLLAIASQAVWAVSDGVYYVSQKPTTSAVVDIKGHKTFVGIPFEEKFDSEQLVSLTNENSCFTLLLRQNIGIKPSHTPVSLILILGDKSIWFTGDGSDSTNRWWDSTISDLDFVNRVATFFKITPKKRQHPDAQFTASFVADSKGYAVGGPVMVTLKLTNCGTSTFRVPEPSIHSGMIGTFTFTAYGEGPNWDPKNDAVANQPYSPQSMDQMYMFVMIKPGDTRSVPVNLNDYLVINKAGTYHVRGSYAFTILGNEIPFQNLWDDFATAEFEVTIK